MAKTNNGEAGEGARVAKVSADGLATAARTATQKGPPPVHLWNPPFCGDIDMRIARDGTWFYLGTPMGRHALVKLFAGIIWREGDDYFLVTPGEKVGIKVDDAPFIAVDFDLVADGLAFVTKVEDRVVAGPDHPIRVTRDPVSGEPSPYVLFLRILVALFDRKSFYRLVDLGEVEGDWFGVRSQGVFFPIIPAAEL